MSRVNSSLALCAVIAASILGAVLSRSIPSAVFPQIQFNRAIVLADSGDLPPEQMLVAVTRPLEEASYGVVGVNLVRSTTTRGGSEIDVSFNETSDAVSTFQLLNASLGEARSRLPADTKVDARLLSTGTFPILELSLSSRVRNLTELTDIAQYDLGPSLHRIPGVYRVETVGAKYREYLVRLDPARMLQHKLTPQDVVSGLAKANVIQSAGRVLDAHRMLLTVVTTDLHGVEQLETVPVSNVNGQPIYVRDIGDVELGIVEDYIRTASEHGPAVLVGVSQQPDGNTTLISSQAHTILDDFRARYPDVSFSTSYDQATLVQESFDSVRDAILLGLILAVAVVYGFTRSPLSALIAAVVVPCTILITFAVMSAIGMTFNMMTLGGLAAGIGLFIDDAIVMIEAMHRAHAGGVGAEASVQSALGELTRPLIASTATVIVVFLPLVFLSGVTGVFFRALAFTLGGGLAVSLLLALYFTPALELLVERWRGAGREAGGLFALVQRAYIASLKPFLRLPVLALIVAVASLVAAALFYRTIGTDYLPELDEGAFILDYTTPPESTLADTQALLAKIEDVLKTTPEVTGFARRTGTQRGFFLTESNRGDITVLLKGNRARDIDDIMDAVRRRILETVPGVRIEFSQVLQDLIGDLSGTPEPVEVKVFGADQAEIEDSARQVAKRLRSIPGLVDMFDGLVLSNPEEEVAVNQTAVQRYGVSADDVQAALRTVVEGSVATQVREGDRLLGVRVRYPDQFHRSLAVLGQTLIDTPNGGRIPLSEVATLRWMGERNELDRERLRPVVHVTSRIEGSDLGTAIGRIKDRLRDLALPPGVTLEYGGLYAEQQKAFSQLELVLVAATVAMLLVLVWEFAALGPALAVLIGALSCLAGSFIGLKLTGITLNISSFMGIIMVAGITAKNGILLLDHAERDIGSGAEPKAAMVAAAQIRLRPILMTTLATAAGLLPLALGLGAGAKVQQPLAVAVIGGLVYALLLSTPLAGGIYLVGKRRRKAVVDNPQQDAASSK
ncbi:MAG TPA: efflux RND transporter permease subunit [Candidatus Binataceae bacterium]|nr:efflux RND transporter permease subunit [Candidatus Binataceae bacterium]